MYKKFTEDLQKGFGEDAKLLDGSTLKIEKVYPLDVNYSTPEEVPDSVKSNKHFASLSGYDISSTAESIKRDFGKVDYLIHSVANGSEVERPLLQTTRKGYLAASSSSAYSMVAMVQSFAPIMPKGGAAMSISYLAAERVVPGYGGGMSSAKAQLESDTKLLAWEAGRKYGIRVNTISAGPVASRAASAIKKGKDGAPGFIDRSIKHYVANAPLTRRLTTDDVGRAALALSSELSGAITGTTQHVDMGLHAMALSVDSATYVGFLKDHTATHPEWLPGEDK